MPRDSLDIWQIRFRFPSVCGRQEGWARDWPQRNQLWHRRERGRLLVIARSVGVHRTSAQNPVSTSLYLKETLREKKASRALLIEEAFKKKRLATVFQSNCDLVCCNKLTFEGRKYQAVSTSMFGLAVCLWRQERGGLTCVAEVYVASRVDLSLLFICKERTNMSAPWGAQIGNKK